MNASVYRFSLDIHEPHSSVCLDVKRGDTNSRLLLITLSENGVPYHISPECYAVFTAKKPDGKKVFNHCTIDGDQIRYVLTPQTVAVEGRLDCEIKLYGADDTLITSPCFDIIVMDTVYNEGDEIESKKEIDALAHLISEVLKLLGPNATASALLIDILRNAVYRTNQSANITALEAALSSGGSEPEMPDSEIEQTGSILSIVSGVTATQSNSVLAIS